MELEKEKISGGMQEIIPELYKDLVKPGMSAIGKALGDVTQFCVLPMNMVGFMAEKAKANLNKRLTEYKEKLEQIPQEKVTEVHPQIAVPVLQKLSYTTNDDIANLFTNLLATASNIDTVDKAHPGFENIISQLSPDEARIVQYLQNASDIQYCQLKAYRLESEGYRTLFPKSTMIPFRVNLDFPANVHAYFANLVRLGILVDMVDIYRVSNAEYDKIMEAYHFAETKAAISKDYKRIEDDKSYYDITAFGRMFIDACTDRK